MFSLFCSQLSGGLVIQDLKTKTNCEENWGERAFSPVPPFLRVILFNTCSIHYSNMIPMGIFLYFGLVLIVLKSLLGIVNDV